MRDAFLIGMLFSLGNAMPGSAQEIQAATDPRAEILAIMFRIAGAPEYSGGRLEPYTSRIDSAFGPFRDHPAIHEINRLRSEYGVGFEAVMSMAAHITDPVTFSERTPIDAPSSVLSARWRGAEARPFLRLAGEFARAADVDRFLRAQQPLYDSASVRMRRLVEQRMNVPWFDAFYGEPPGAVFIVVPVLANSGGSYGPRFADGTIREVYAHVGIGTADALGFPVIGEDLLRTIAHEFIHSYVNHVVEAHYTALAGPGERIYGTVAATMSPQAYGSWRTMMIESVVRASVIRYLLATEGAAAAASETRSQRGVGFIWMPELVALFAEYESDRGTYPTLTSFMPRIVAYYQELAERIEGMTADFDARRPTINSSSIADGARDVDPSITQITVRFDQRMGPGISMSGGSIPEITGYGFDPTGTAFTLHVALRPGREYGIRFTGFSFASVDGYPLREYRLRFATTGR